MCTEQMESWAVGVWSRGLSRFCTKGKEAEWAVAGVVGSWRLSLSQSVAITHQSAGAALVSSNSTHSFYNSHSLELNGVTYASSVCTCLTGDAPPLFSSILLIFQWKMIQNNDLKNENLPPLETNLDDSLEVQNVQETSAQSGDYVNFTHGLDPPKTEDNPKVKKYFPK